MLDEDVEYHERRAARHRDMAEVCPPDVSFIHLELAKLHGRRAEALAAGDRTFEGLLLARDL